MKLKTFDDIEKENMETDVVFGYIIREEAIKHYKINLNEYNAHKHEDWADKYFHISEWIKMFFNLTEEDKLK